MTEKNKANEIVSEEPIDKPSEEISLLEKHKEEVKKALEEAKKLPSLVKNNEKLNWHVCSLCPLDVNFALPVGLAKDSETITQILEMIDNTESSIFLPDVKSKNKKDAFASAHYLNVGGDTSTIRLFTWTYQIDSFIIQFHVFPNRIAVAEIKLVGLYDDDPKSLDEAILQLTNALIGEAYEHFKILLAKLFENQESDKEDYVKLRSLLRAENNDLHSDSGNDIDKAKIYWPSRSLMLTKEQATDPARSAVIRHWLCETIKQDDADEIIKGDLNYSMTWLKYVLVDDGFEKTFTPDFHIDAMVIAQYCYTAQEKCNRELRDTIESVFHHEKKALERQLQKSKDKLEEARVSLKLHKVTVNESMRLLQPRKRDLIKNIFIGWEYGRLVENGDVMLDLCADKINESNSRQAKISAYKTEYILIGISLFTVLDFFFFVTQFSREAMANPTLDHNDGGPSSFLTVIANIPADLMFFIGVVAAGFIFLAYRKVKG